MANRETFLARTTAYGSANGFQHDISSYTELTATIHGTNNGNTLYTGLELNYSHERYDLYPNTTELTRDRAIFLVNQFLIHRRVCRIRSHRLALLSL